MPLIVSGYLAIDTRKLREHEGHHLRVAVVEDRVSLSCLVCSVLVEREPEPRTDLPCGCRTQASHDEGVAMQQKLRKDLGITRSACVGCYLGDDGPSIHDCYIHRA